MKVHNLIRILALDDNPLNRHVLDGICAKLPSTVIYYLSSDTFPVEREIDIVLINLNHRGVCSRYLIGRATELFPIVPRIGYLNTFDSAELQEYKRMVSEPLILLTYQELILQLHEYLLLIRHDEELISGSPNNKVKLRASNLERFMRLSPKEKDIFCLIGKGLGSSEISGIFNCSIRTVETHVRNIGNKLKLSGQYGLRRLAIKMTAHNQCRVLAEASDHYCIHTQETIGRCPYLKAQ